MAWLESHQTLRNHPKTLELAALLEIHFAQAIGHLHCLWWWALDYAPNGDLSRWSKEAIAAGSGWTLDADEFVEALREAGFLDDLMIHDWDEYAGRLVAQREANRERKRTSRAKPETATAVTRPSHARHAPVTGLHNTTQQDTTGQNTTQPTEPAGAGLKEIEAEWFSKTGQTATPFLFEQFEEAMKRWGTEATIEAIAETGKQNARSWKYTKAILERWASQGRDSPRGGNSLTDDPATRYLGGKFGHLAQVRK